MSDQDHSAFVGGDGICPLHGRDHGYICEPLRPGHDPVTNSALTGVATPRGRRCGIHGDDTSSGRCGSCDQLEADRAEAYLAEQAEEAADRAQYEAGRAEDHELRDEGPW